MSRHTREDLDARVRRAWPVDVAEAEASPHAADRLRTLIGDRLATDAGPTAHEPPRDRHDVGAARRRVAAALAGVVLIAGGAGVGVLVANRIQRPAAELGGDPTAKVRSAIAATRQAVAELSVTHEKKEWEGVDSGPSELEGPVDDSEPAMTTTTVVTAGGDWSYVAVLTPAAGIAGRTTVGMRSVDGQWYARSPVAQGWVRIVAEDGEEPRRPPIALLDGPMVVELLEHYDGGWTARRDSSSGLIRYDATTPGEAFWLAVGVSSQMGPQEDPSDVLAPPSTATSTVRLWIDDETGRIDRVFLELTGVDAMDGGTPHAEQQTVTLDYGGAPPFEAPHPVTDEIPLEDWCAWNGCR